MLEDREELAFLEANMRGEQPAEGGGSTRLAVLAERPSPSADLRVILQDAPLDLARLDWEERQDELLLLREVALAPIHEEGEEAGDHRRHVGVLSPAEALRMLQRDVVLAGQRREPGTPMHAPTMAPAARGAIRSSPQGSLRALYLASVGSAAGATSMMHPAVSGSRGTKLARCAAGSRRSSSPRVMPRCSVHTAIWFSRTASR